MSAKPKAEMDLDTAKRCAPDWRCARCKVGYRTMARFGKEHRLMSSASRAPAKRCEVRHCEVVYHDIRLRGDAPVQMYADPPAEYTMKSRGK